MNQPSWYRNTESFLLNEGRWVITLALVILIGVSLFFLVSIWTKKKFAVPAAAWVTYMFMP